MHVHKPHCSEKSVNLSYLGQEDNAETQQPSTNHKRLFSNQASGGLERLFQMYYTSLYTMTLSITGRPFSSLSPQPFSLLCSQQAFFWVGSEVEEGNSLWVEILV